MSYDVNVPLELKSLQTWFASVITLPIDHESHISTLTADGIPVEIQACEHIKSSPTLSPSQRMEIYNQQYWWRVLNVMQSTYSMATHMLGYQKFNDLLAMPYLQTFPSEHYSLSHLGDRFNEWMKHHYQGEDKQILTDAIAIDDAMNRAFFSSSLPPITENMSPEDSFSVPATLQPHITLFELEYDLFAFRKEIQEKDPDYWSSHHFPNLKHALVESGGHFPLLKRDKTYYFIVFRTLGNQVVWEEISAIEYQLLSLFRTESSIQKACEWLANLDQNRATPELRRIQEWIQGWIAKKLLAKTRPV